MQVAGLCGCAKRQRGGGWETLCLARLTTSTGSSVAQGLWIEFAAQTIPPLVPLGPAYLREVVKGGMRCTRQVQRTGAAGAQRRWWVSSRQPALVGSFFSELQVVRRATSTKD